jgi:hypothetical protein
MNSTGPRKGTCNIFKVNNGYIPGIASPTSMGPEGCYKPGLINLDEQRVYFVRLAHPLTRKDWAVDDC